MFAGASTPDGFINFFDHILPLSMAKKRYFLKGSSGSGKSTFIKKVATKFEALGVNCERFHCANDIESLDALFISDRGLCIIDATQPHSCDPQIPIAIDKIIDFAEFIDERKIVRHVDKIKALIQTKKILNEKAAGYLEAVGNIFRTKNKTYEAALKRDSLDIIIKKWLKLLDPHAAPNAYGIDRKMFLSAVTPDGFVSFSDSYFNGCKVYGLSCEIPAGASIFLNELKTEANALGINTESFYCPFAPDLLEYLHIPKMGLAFAKMGDRFSYHGAVYERIDMSSCVDAMLLENIKSGMDLDNERVLFDSLLTVAVDSMSALRALHGDIEDIYLQTIDFERVDEMTEKIIQEIFE